MLPVYHYVRISSFSVELFFSPLCPFCLLDLHGDVTRVATRLHRASVAGGRSQSGVNPVDRHGDTGIRQREHVVLIFRISLRPRAILALFQSPVFRNSAFDSAASASKIIRVEALYIQLSIQRIFDVSRIHFLSVKIS